MYSLLFVLALLSALIISQSFTLNPRPSLRSVAISVANAVHPFELGVENLYKRSTRIKCPFFRRRIADSLDNVSLVWLFLQSRHKSLSLLPGCSPSSNEPKVNTLSVGEISRVIERDWNKALVEGDSDFTSSNSNWNSDRAGKGYYITGKLTKEIYRDDCYFDGPDPDMPVRGLRKYLSASAHLFDHKKSRADMISIEFSDVERQVRVKWRIEGILNLPWHPRLKPWTGTTTYHIDDSNLISMHIETWDISVWDAFLSTLFPQFYKGAPPAPAPSSTPYC